MQGSVQSPPIIVQSSRPRAAWQLLIFAGLVAAGVFSLSQAPSTVVYLLTVAAIFGALYAARKLVKPDVLELSPKGLHYRIAWRNRRFDWNEIGIFRVDTRPFGWPRLKTVVFSCNPDDPARLYRVDLGSQWEIENNSLIALLDRAQANWRGHD